MTAQPYAIPAIDEFRRAAEGLRDIIVRTSLVPMLDAGTPTDVFLKPEIHQCVGSFKIRGIFHAVSQLDPGSRARGVSTVSAGNTAQALAWAARHFGVEARTIMPEHAPRTKIDAVRRMGGTPILVSTDEVFRFLREHGWDDEPYAFIHPWISRDVMIGHGSLGLEILDERPDVQTVYVPVGGGGLIAGVGCALKALRPSIRLVAVEPSGCPSLHTSLEAGRPMQVPCSTICDGVAVPYITDEMYPLLSSIVDDCVLVDDADVEQMIRRLAADHHVIVEPSGALAPVAAVLDNRGPSVALLTGGSIDMDKLLKILA